MADGFSTEEDDILDGEDPAEEVVAVPAPKNGRAWRSIERYRELRELRRNLDDLTWDDAGATLDDLNL